MEVYLTRHARNRLRLYAISAEAVQITEVAMRIEFDPEADALYVRFRDERPTDNVDLQEGITADFDGEHRLIGLEILNVSHRLPPEALATVTVQNLLAPAH